MKNNVHTNFTHIQSHGLVTISGNSWNKNTLFQWFGCDGKKSLQNDFTQLLVPDTNVGHRTELCGLTRSREISLIVNI